jgi:hypothetical protein
VRVVAKRIQRELAASFPEICVEMSDDILFPPIRCFPVESSHPIFPRWARICKTILSECDISEWTSIECWRWGIEEPATENPVTVVVSVIKRAQGPFHTSTQQIRRILAQDDLGDVDILFQESEIQRCAIGPFLSREDSTLPAHPGMSIGINNSDAMSSTSAVCRQGMADFWVDVLPLCVASGGASTIS